MRLHDRQPHRPRSEEHEPCPYRPTHGLYVAECASFLRPPWCSFRPLLKRSSLKGARAWPSHAPRFRFVAAISRACAAVSPPAAAVLRSASWLKRKSCRPIAPVRRRGQIGPEYDVRLRGGCPAALCQRIARRGAGYRLPETPEWFHLSRLRSGPRRGRGDWAMSAAAERRQKVSANSSLRQALGCSRSGAPFHASLSCSARRGVRPRADRLARHRGPCGIRSQSVRVHEGDCARQFACVPHRGAAKLRFVTACAVLSDRRALLQNENALHNAGNISAASSGPRQHARGSHEIHALLFCTTCLWPGFSS